MPRPFDRERTKLADTLIRLRQRHGGVSQKELSRRTGGAVSDGHIAQIETGDRGASLETLEAIAKALELSPEERQALIDSAALDISSPTAEDRAILGAAESLRAMDERIRRLEAQIEELLSRPPDGPGS
jgi:transcriptional regulator with XRE-family HTH domain